MGVPFIAASSLLICSTVHIPTSKPHPSRDPCLSPALPSALSTTPIRRIVRSPVRNACLRSRTCFLGGDGYFHVGGSTRLKSPEALVFLAARASNSVIVIEMLKSKPLRVLPVSPLSLRCPFCEAEPGHDCATSEGGFAVVHVARIKKAASLDSLNASRASMKHPR